MLQTNRFSIRHLWEVTMHLSWLWCTVCDWSPLSWYHLAAHHYHCYLSPRMPHIWTFTCNSNLPFNLRQEQVIFFALSFLNYQNNFKIITALQVSIYFILLKNFYLFPFWPCSVVLIFFIYKKVQIIKLFSYLKFLGYQRSCKHVTSYHTVNDWVGLYDE